MVLPSLTDSLSFSTQDKLNKRYRIIENMSLEPLLVALLLQV